MSTTITRLYNFVDDKNNGVPITASRVDGELDAMVTKLNQKVLSKSSAPSSPVDGQTWVDTTNDLLKAYLAGGWKEIPTITSPTQGDVIYYNGTNWVTLGVGTSGQYLQTQGASSNPKYSNITDLTIASATEGDLLHYDGTSWTRLPVGATGLVLVSQGVGTVPKWGGSSGSQEITTSGNFVAPSDVDLVYVTLVGGGGGGGGGISSNYGGGGGGGGAVVFNYPYAVSPYGTYSVVIGTGGTGGAVDNPGTVGGVTTFDGVLTAMFGSGGLGNGTGGAGGITYVVGAGSVTAGGTRTKGFAQTGGTGGTKGASEQGAGGGGSLGAGGKGGATGTVGGNAPGYGGGGGAGGLNAAGGLGGNGVCYISW